MYAVMWSYSMPCIHVQVLIHSVIIVWSDWCMDVWRPCRWKNSIPFAVQNSQNNWFFSFKKKNDIIFSGYFLLYITHKHARASAAHTCIFMYVYVCIYKIYFMCIECSNWFLKCRRWVLSFIYLIIWCDYWKVVKV